MKIKYSCYEYEIFKDSDPSHYIYRIYLNDPDRKFWTGEDTINSDEWYDSEEDAIKAACENIDSLESGPDEPDYDAPSAHERYINAHEDRQKLRGY